MHRRTLFFGKAVQAVEVLSCDEHKDRIRFLSPFGESLSDARGILLHASGKVTNCATRFFAHDGCLSFLLHRIHPKGGREKCRVASMSPYANRLNYVG